MTGKEGTRRVEGLFLTLMTGISAVIVATLTLTLTPSPSPRGLYPPVSHILDKPENNGNNEKLTREEERFNSF